VALAGREPGLTLRSTLACGTQPGGGALVLDGQQSELTGSYGVDNKLAKSLGLSGSTLQLALNEPLGCGEQFYGYLSGEPNWFNDFRKDAPRRVVGGGTIVPLGSDGFSINPEFTWSDTQPIVPSALVLKSRSRFERYPAHDLSAGPRSYPGADIDGNTPAQRNGASAHFL
jgi:hemolysin activation/secretion protein